LKLFTGRVNTPLARDIAKYLGVDLGVAKVESFADGEISIKVHENVRGRDVFIVHRFVSLSTTALWSCCCSSPR